MGQSYQSQPPPPPDEFYKNIRHAVILMAKKVQARQPTVFPWSKLVAMDEKGLDSDYSVDFKGIICSTKI